MSGPSERLSRTRTSLQARIEKRTRSCKSLSSAEEVEDEVAKVIPVRDEEKEQFRVPCKAFHA